MHVIDFKSVIYSLELLNSKPSKMDVAGSEIGQKMRSAIKAKLTELGCYVDDELPDYVMVMVANKRTRAQMEDDLQLFLGDNTELFVNWLHQVLKKLQEVTVTAPLKPAERDRSKERSLSKERKAKEKKEKTKSKKADSKKSKKKDKEKMHRKKEEKKAHKSKKKSKSHESIRPNIPPMLMNMEKVSEPSITDVFAGQILKSHGITLESLKDDNYIERKPLIKETKRPILPIIDPATISSQPDPDLMLSPNSESKGDSQDSVQIASISSEDTKDNQIKEMTEIEAKIQGLKEKLADQLDSMSDDDDFLNIRTEAEELMNDFVEDVCQEITEKAPVSTPTPPLSLDDSPSISSKELASKPKESTSSVETLPHIELNLPKRPVRERLGAREVPKKPDVTEAKRQEVADSPERFTPEPMPEFLIQTKSAKSRLSDLPEKKTADDTSSDKSESGLKRLNSRVSVLDSRTRSCASVVRVRPRPRGPAPASSLLLRAVADAHKSLLNIPPKVNPEPQKVKRALVLPMRRVGDPKIVIQVPADRAHTDSPTDNISLDVDSEDDKRIFGDGDRDEYVPTSITRQIKNTDYVPSHRTEVRTASRRDDSLVIETINIHNRTVDKDKNTQFIVTMDGYHPNAFLAKKLMTEGIIDDEEEIKNTLKDSSAATKTKELSKSTEVAKTSREKSPEKTVETKKRVSNDSIESDTQVIIKQEKLDVVDDKEQKEKERKHKKEKLTPEKNDQKSKDKKHHDMKDKKEQVKDKNGNDDLDSKVTKESQILEKTAEKRKSNELVTKVDENSPPVKKRKASPIVFDVGKKEKAPVELEVEKKEKETVKERERTESASSDSHVIVTATNSHKYDSLPPLSAAERKGVWCRAFPLCRYGNACAFQHPRCKFAAACTRRNCVYAHSPATTALPPSISSHVVPVANYKTITAAPLASMCKYYPSCANPSCTFFHPKPCRYGAACLNKIECNFYHADLPTAKWRYPV